MVLIVSPGWTARLQRIFGCRQYLGPSLVEGMAVLKLSASVPAWTSVPSLSPPMPTQSDEY